MNKIGIDFDINKMYDLSEKEIREYVRHLAYLGVRRLDFFYSMFLEPEHVGVKDIVIDEVKKNDIKVSIHSLPVDGMWLTYRNRVKMEEGLEAHKKALYELRVQLEKYGINYEVPIVFHSGYYDDIDKEELFKLNIEFYTELAKEAKNYDFLILAETLSYNHPHVKVIGNNWEDIERLCDEIPHENFGICWDMGHTHLNYTEHGSDMLPNEKIAKRIKHTHIHRVLNGTLYGHSLHRYAHNIEFEEGKDHGFLMDDNFQDEEIKWLVENNYNYAYSLELAYNLLLEHNVNYDKVFDSVKILNRRVNKFKNDKHVISIMNS
ncbi:MAG: sugar phosphate isomerase/epimerase [Clostridia bacterium]|jgi:sugar phosphate isomerase/epimerase|nr:sugar phosphate isomerase/epimerase [Clostridia bacterium]